MTVAVKLILQLEGKVGVGSGEGWYANVSAAAWMVVTGRVIAPSGDPWN